MKDDVEKIFTKERDDCKHAALFPLSSRISASEKRRRKNIFHISALLFTTIIFMAAILSFSVLFVVNGPGGRSFYSGGSIYIDLPTTFVWLQ
jgi:hypothetical protein